MRVQVAEVVSAGGVVRGALGAAALKRVDDIDFDAFGVGRGLVSAARKGKLVFKDTARRK